MNIRTLLLILVILVAGIGLYILAYRDDTDPNTLAEPMNFEECAVRFPVMESHPRQCMTPSGVRFVEEVPAPVPTEPGATSPGIANLITVTAPMNNQKISSPLTITGEARGTWYFEASFPLELRNAQGQVIAQHYAEAQGEWMTENFVPFRSSLTFPQQPAGSTGTLILRNDNPSGDPARDRSVSIPVRF